MKNYVRALVVLSLPVALFAAEAIKVADQEYKLQSTIARNKDTMKVFSRMPAQNKDDIGFLFVNIKNNSLELINALNWQKSLSGRGRYAVLDRAQRIDSDPNSAELVCYLGTPFELNQEFFDSNLKLSISNIPEEIELYPSSDGMLMGFKYTIGFSKFSKTFRVEACSGVGKSPLVSSEKISTARLITADPPLSKVVPPVGDPIGAGPKGIETGFTIQDNPKYPAVSKLPKFSLRADYDKATFDEEKDRPWKGMDLSTLDGAEKFAIAVQKYVYEGMGDQNKDANLNFIATENKTRYWCHMPWLNVGPSGREGVHGLTNERALQKSPIFPDATEGSDWGVAFYNGKGCQTIERVFGTVASPNSSPKWGKSTFEDGTLTYKILFTTAKFPSMTGAMKWKGNVSLPKSNTRTLRDVYHIQMDIAVKDSTLKGVSAGSGGWVMSTYYFDKSYASPLKIKGLQAGLLKMRPQGIQTGFGAPAGDNKDTILFVSAKNNGFQGRLNGPADNPKSSCISCHGTAGTTIAMSPGIMNDSQWEKAKETNLDFSQQLALAKRNVETTPE